MVKKLTIGWHSTIVPTIIKGVQFNENTLKNSNFNVTAQIFLKSPMKVSGSKINEKQIEETKEYLKKNNVYLVVHGQYLLNFIREGKEIHFARKSLVDDLKMLEMIIPEKNKNKTGVVIHLGKNVNKKSVEECIINFTENIINVIEKTKECGLKIILETSTKTKGPSDIFHNIETFGKLVHNLKDKLGKETFDKRIGFCIDTCHIYASGYSIESKKGFTDFMKLWKTQIGSLTLFHLNDSKGILGCCRDCHEQIGNGLIYKESKDGLKALLKYAKKNNIPIIIESGGIQDEELALIKTLI